MTAPDLCRLASAAFPGLTFTPIDFGGLEVSARAPELRVIHSRNLGAFAVVVRGERSDFQSQWWRTISDAHADALACRAEYEPPVEPAPTTQGALDL